MMVIIGDFGPKPKSTPTSRCHLPKCHDTPIWLEKRVTLGPFIPNAKRAQWQTLLANRSALDHVSKLQVPLKTHSAR